MCESTAMRESVRGEENDNGYSAQRDTAVWQASMLPTLRESAFPQLRSEYRVVYRECRGNTLYSVAWLQA